MKGQDQSLQQQRWRAFSKLFAISAAYSYLEIINSFCHQCCVVRANGHWQYHKYWHELQQSKKQGTWNTTWDTLSTPSQKSNETSHWLEQGRGTWHRRTDGRWRIKLWKCKITVHCSPSASTDCRQLWYIIFGHYFWMCPETRVDAVVGLLM